LLALLLLGCAAPAAADLFGPQADQRLEHVALYPALDGSTPALPSTLAPPVGQAPILGPQPFIVILAYFQDLNFSRAVAELDNVVFGLSANYFAEVSYGVMQLTGERAGPVQLPRRLGFYGGEFGEEEQFELLRDALVAASPFVEYADGQRILVLHAGADEAVSRLSRDIWSFATIAPQPFSTPQGVFGLTFAIVAEFDPLGAYVHEMAHTFGLPDLYATGGQAELVGVWDLMAVGSNLRRGDLPSHLSAWGKIRLGWLPEERIRQLAVGQTAEVDLAPLEVPTEAVQALQVPTSASRYYLVELRQPLGFDRGLPSFGVLIYAIDDGRFGYGALRVMTGSRSLSNAAWPVGSEFRDAQSPLTLAVQSATPSSYRVGISFGTGSVILTVVTPFAQGQTITVNGVTYTTDSSGTLQLELEPGIFELGAPPIIETTPGEREVFLAWSDGSTANPRVLELVNDLILRTVYETEYLVQIMSPYDGVAGEGWYREGALARLTVDSPFPDGDGVRRVFTSWSGDAASSNPTLETQVTGPLTVEAEWRTEFFLEVLSQYGTPLGRNWYPEGTTATVSVEGLIAGPPQTRYRFDHWEGAEPSTSTTATVLMSEPREAHVVWVTEVETMLEPRDATDGPLTAPAPLVELMGPDGEVTQVSAYEPFWLTAGVWDIRAVHWHGVDVTLPPSRFTAAVGTEVAIPVRVYPLDVSVRGWLLPFTEPSTASLTLADGTRLSAPITSGPAPELAQVPQGLYDLHVQGLLAGAQLPVAVGATNFVSVAVFSLFDALILLGIALSIGGAVAYARRPAPASPALQKPV
jgi:M6 family metalloprotease-like protein